MMSFSTFSLVVGYQSYSNDLDAGLSHSPARPGHTVHPFFQPVSVFRYRPCLCSPVSSNYRARAGLDSFRKSFTFFRPHGLSLDSEYSQGYTDHCHGVRHAISGSLTTPCEVPHRQGRPPLFLPYITLVGSTCSFMKP